MDGTQITAVVLLGVLAAMEFGGIFIPIHLVGKAREPLSERDAKGATFVFAASVIMISVADRAVADTLTNNLVTAAIGGIWISRIFRVLLAAGQPTRGTVTPAQASIRVAASVAVLAGLLYLLTRAV